MNRALLRADVKQGWPVFLVMTGAMLIYTVTSLVMFDPEGLDEIRMMLTALPEELISAMGFSKIGTDMNSYLGGFLYGFIFIAFPMIYTTVVGYRMVAKHVDSGTMAYLLSTPNSRVKVAMTQGWYLLLSTLVLMGIQVGALISMSEVMFPGMLEIETFLWLNLVTYLVLAVASGMTFLCSCVFSEGKYAIGFGAAIPVVSFMLKMFGEVGGKVEVLKYGSIYMLLER